MKLLYKILRALFVTLLLVVPAVAVTLYVALSIPGVQNVIRDKVASELTRLTGSEVKIGKVEIAPFNRVTVSDAVITDANGQEALRVDHLGAGLSMTDLIVRQKLVVSYAELIGFHINVYRDSAGMSLNIDPIIERFKSKDDKPKSDFTLAITTVVVRKGRLTYNVLSAPEAVPERFDANHVDVSDFRADVRIPAVGGKQLSVEIKRLAAIERSGLRLDNLRLGVEMADGMTRISDFSLDLPESHLAFNDITASFSPLDFDRDSLGRQSLQIATLAGSVVALKDLSPFVEQFAGSSERISIDLSAEGTFDDISIKHFEIGSDHGDMSIMTHGVISDLISGDAPIISLKRLNVNFKGSWLADFIGIFAKPSDRAALLLRNSGEIDLLADVDVRPEPLGIDMEGTLMCDAGSLDITGGISRNGKGRALDVTGHVTTSHFDAAMLSGNRLPVTDLSFDLEGDAAVAGLNTTGNVELEISDLTLNGYALGGVTAEAEMKNRRLYATLNSASDFISLVMEGDCDFSGQLPALTLRLQADSVAAAPFGLGGKFRESVASFTLDASAKGRNVDNLEGWARLSDLDISDHATGRRLPLHELSADISLADSMRTFTLSSDIIDGSVTGEYTPSTLAKSARRIFAEVYPALAGESSDYTLPHNDLTYNFTLKPDSLVTRFFSLPVEVVHPITISGQLSTPQRRMSLVVDVPYIWQKGKLIESSVLSADVNGADDRSSLSLSTVVPTKNGPMHLSLGSDGRSNSTDTEIKWKVKRDHDYHGEFRFTTTFARDTVDEHHHPLLTRINVNPSTMIFNDTAWTVTPSRIDIAEKLISVDNFHAGREGQHIVINGKASADSTDVIRLQLLDIDLDYVFETLNINNVMFGGNATGDFYASQLLTPSPVMYTDNLSVKGLSFNRCVMGDGMIRSAWHNDDKSISIYADISQTDGRHSIIDGMIRPMAEELDFKFYADRARVGFLKPFMSAFSSDVSGYASGFAHLYGTFKLIDLKGDILAEDLKMKLSFTNTVYSVARDSVHITPGRINFKNVVLTDKYGHEARLSGHVAHKCFKEPEFRFNITDARDFLCYDVSERQATDPWYGTIFGNGGVTVTGYPGMVDISVRMATAPKSTFTFVLSDAEQATEYNFITFHDRDKARKDSIAALDPTPAIIRDLRNRRKIEQQGPPTDYVMDFNVDVTPSATLNLIMDPVGGDRIKANGDGHLRMTYSSTGDLKMFGDYRLTRGDYNFTLQDIIIKDFTIVEGSTIKFNGNPYAAQLNIKAAYSVNANLTDLDESFSQDKELNRTNVPVNALLLVTGDMRQPDIDFDLEFPTLTRDVDRKVRSIVSTEDMMNRQIIYLLALNRFYTPDYMNATRGNELVSVASSTISSQLSSMLGQLSDKWTIAPNFRSDRGDFSDVEVDVALSSHLLNNRLLLNGNFGYRDKSLNNNSFIGDFDIRYLLNRSGSIALKAYNRYNDQNYYLKSALTTQGVGVVFKRDFDNIFSFLRPLMKKRKKTTEPSDSSAVVTDSVAAKPVTVSSPE